MNSDPDKIRVKLEVLPDLHRAIGDLILQQPNTAGNLLNVAWTLLRLAVSQINLLRSTGAAATEDDFADMARNAYRTVLATLASKND